MRPAELIQAAAPLPPGGRGGRRRVAMAIERRPQTSGLPGRPHQDSLADILERVLDKGIVIAGDIQINLLEIELLTIKLRLLVASVDKAQEMGINWWQSDPMLNGGQRDLQDENRRLRERLQRV